ncbi:MAG: hypothetical protein B6241_01865 [Spirochaetaceae bacterium 4572_59]|nr:MAG: hypothetical protein B6241_01865 [Spirochaetaceae bacterium 4572_59]
MKILFVCSARSWGGNEKWSSMAMAELQKQGHVVHIMLRNPVLSKRFGKSIPWHFAPFITPFDPISFLLGLILLLWYRPDAIISTKKAEYFTFGVLSRILKIRHILRLGIVRDLDSGWKRFIYTRLNEGIIVNARRTKDNFEKYDFVDQEKIKLIYNGIPESGISEKMTTHNKSSDDLFRIVSVGTLTPRKGFHILIEALSLLSQDLQDKIRLSIVGSGIMRKELETLIKDKNLNDSVILEGYQKDPSPFLRESDLFALISENEGISNALLEAMIMGLPVITTVSGGTAEFMTDKQNGCLVERNAPEIALRLKEILSDEGSLKIMGLAGQDRVREFFSLQKMGQEVASFLNPAEQENS